MLTVAQYHDKEQKMLDLELHESRMYSPEFRIVIESHLPRLKNEAVDFINVEPVEAYRFEYDYLALLRYKNIPYRYHWIVMRVNGFDSPFQAHRDIRHIFVPNFTTIDRLFNMFLNTRGFV